jgi:hypothetical protein
VSAYKPLGGAQAIFLSSGMGVQSTTLSLLAIDGVLPKPDAVITADTGWEPREVYAHMARLTDALTGAGIPVHVVRRGNLRDDHLNPVNPFSSMPLFVRGRDGRDAMGRRQCTHDYKLRPVRAKTRELLGFSPPARVPRRLFAETWVGFSTDEVHRVNSNASPGYARLTYPLLDLGMSRKDCVRYLTARGWGQTPKSACIGCPFHGNAAWRDLRDNHPEEWADAIAFDKAIREAPRDSRSGMRGTQYLHRSLLPLDEAPIDRVSRREWNERQSDLIDLVAEEGDPDGCSPYGCRSGAALPSNVGAA